MQFLIFRRVKRRRRCDKAAAPEQPCFRIRAWFSPSAPAAAGVRVREPAAAGAPSVAPGQRPRLLHVRGPAPAAAAAALAAPEQVVSGADVGIGEGGTEAQHEPAGCRRRRHGRTGAGEPPTARGKSSVYPMTTSLHANLFVSCSFSTRVLRVIPPRSPR